MHESMHTDMKDDEFNLLKNGAEALSLDVREHALRQIRHYLDLMLHWNKKINLTAIQDRQQMLHAHILDSFSLIPQLMGSSSLLDVGTGAGLPGIPVAVWRPELTVTLIESNGKKVAFLNQCKIELELDNLTVVEGRVEQWHPEGKSFDTIVCRAFSDLAQFVSSARHLLAPGGQMIAMKGAVPYDELGRVSTEVASVNTLAVTVPGLSAQRHFIQMTL